MAWSLITLCTGFALWGLLWFLADTLEKKKAMQQTANSNTQDDMDDYED